MLARVDQELLVGTAAGAGETAAALMNCGRFPMTVRIFKPSSSERIALGDLQLRSAR